MRLIDADILLETLESKMFSAEVYNREFDGTVIGNLLCLGDVKELIEELPTVEAKPVVHGEWIDFDAEANEWSCSKCGNIWQLNYGTPEENNMNFCQNCGTDMRGVKNE